MPDEILQSDETALLLDLLEETSHETGEEFFRLLVKNLARMLGAYGAILSIYIPERRNLRPRAYWLGKNWVEPLEYGIAGSPCERVILSGESYHIEDRLTEYYPANATVTEHALVSYTGMPFKDRSGCVIGNLAVIDKKPLKDGPRFRRIFTLFGIRAAAELLRVQAEATVRKREQKLNRLIDGAMDGIIDFDEQLAIHLINASATRMFALNEQDSKATLGACLSDDSLHKLRRYMHSFEGLPEGERQIWISGGLDAKRANNEPFKIEATLSQGDLDGRAFYTLIMRDVDERLQAERRIEQLQEETAFLKDELNSLQQAGEIIGESLSVKEALLSVAQVADTDASVLILGETGTGKELFARAIHDHSRRKDAPLVTVNCAAIPKELVESEFFGHEKGAFTGAVSRRMGRFERARGGTIFLDEIGELPLDVQAKLLRVLQEGEYEPVGGSSPKNVDVRVIAATHRKLGDAVQRGEFREDLYYRLNVFPIRIPPLRERGDDIRLLTNAFVDRIAKRMGRHVTPLSEDDISRLLAYHWPGNVRELQNIIERAVITAKDGRLDINRILHTDHEVETRVNRPPIGEQPVIRTVQEMHELEIQNIVRALEACDWRVSGNEGAAQCLDMKPSTLSARIKALAIQREAYKKF